MRQLTHLIWPAGFPPLPFRLAITSNGIAEPAYIHASRAWRRSFVVNAWIDIARLLLLLVTVRPSVSSFFGRRCSQLPLRSHPWLIQYYSLTLANSLLFLPRSPVAKFELVVQRCNGYIMRMLFCFIEITLFCVYVSNRRRWRRASGLATPESTAKIEKKKLGPREKSGYCVPSHML